MRPVPQTGHWHDDYERGRPGWPEAVLDLAGTPASAIVLELGAGTGKLTRLLLARFRRVLRSRLPEADVRPGRAEAIPIADQSVDAVFAAEAFQ